MGAIARITDILSKNSIGIKNIEIINNRENNYGSLRLIVNSYKERDDAFNLLNSSGYDIQRVDSYLYASLPFTAL